MTQECQDGYICHECLAIFLFEGDFKIHSEQTGHRNKGKMKITALVDIGKKDFLFFELA